MPPGISGAGSVERSPSGHGPADGMAVPGSDRYRAFMSYSHAVDRTLAPAVQRGLVHMAKPWYRMPAFRLFRDDTSLTASPGLWSSIEEALNSSRFFILMA